MIAVSLGQARGDFFCVGSTHMCTSAELLLAYAMGSFVGARRFGKKRASSESAVFNRPLRSMLCLMCHC